MAERRKIQRSRSLKGGRILFNNKQSVISCTVRNQSVGGANLQVERAVGVPAFFELLVDGEAAARPCNVIWKSQNRIGIEYCPAGATQPAECEAPDPVVPAVVGSAPRSDLLALRAALDEVPLGIVQLDAGLRALYINRAFRAMWHLPEAKAQSRPAFVTLMYHGRDSRAYDVRDGELDAYIERRVAHVRAGDATPIDLRLAGGEIIRFHCTTLPSGGRLLSYTEVTDIVRRADELERLRAALDGMEQGVILLDHKLDVEFMNAAVRRRWHLPEARASALNFADLVGNARTSKAFGMLDDALEIYIAQRVARVRSGDPRPMDLRHADGGIVRCQCSVLPGGGRMLTYTDVTDLFRRADDARRFAASP